MPKSPRHIHTGELSALYDHESTDGFSPSRIYYMYANMTSLNNWRSARGFSQSLSIRIVVSFI